ncbi:MAG: T9SS C-terminal target domain-containing protein [Saprospirales bacterium]|nr:MAG: T9SS C-terminal target domain-containing protein [Saprospirales bacterium]
MRYLLVSLMSICCLSSINTQTSEYVGLNMKISELGGDTIRATLITDYFENMISFEFNLNWDPAKIEFVDLDYTHTEIGLRPDFFNLDNTNDGRARIIWFTAGCETLMEGDSLFSFIFIQKTDDFVIVPPPEQMLFYDCEGNELRMEYLDNQGQRIFFGEPPTSLNEILNTDIDWRVYPNPTSDYISLEFSQTVSGSLIIYNNLGKRILSKSLYNTANVLIDVSSLAAGQYFLEVIDNKVRLQESIIVH